MENPNQDQDTAESETQDGLGSDQTTQEEADKPEPETETEGATPYHETRKEWVMINDLRNKIMACSTFVDGKGHVSFIHPLNKGFQPDLTIFFEDRDTMQTLWILLTQALSGKLNKEYESEFLEYQKASLATASCKPHEIPQEYNFFSPEPEYFVNIMNDIIAGGDVVGGKLIKAQNEIQ
jgi:hypothetical protein